MTDAETGEVEPLGELFVDEPAEIGRLLQRLQDASAVVSIQGLGGATVNATLWTHDAERGVVSFSADPDDPKLQTLVESDAAIVIADFRGGLLRFDLSSLVLVRRGRDCALNASYPKWIERVHRRASVRVRPIARTTAIARLHHPAQLTLRLTLRVLDVSETGCALFLPDAVPPISPGALLNPVLVELDAETRLRTALRVQHIVALHPASKGVRLGCRIVAVPDPGDDRLAGYVDRAQRRKPFFTMG